MRRVVVPPVCLVLLSAFFLAPYQHVHLGTNRVAGADHDHADVIVHTHFYVESIRINRSGGSNLKDSHGDHASQLLDIFTPLPQASLSEFALPELWLLLFPPSDLLAGSVEVTEPCGHDPPLLDFSVPRAPPV